VSTGLKTKTCGREPSSDIVLDDATVSRLHAHMELAKDGLVYVQDNHSRNGTFLNRNDSWIRVRKVTVCIGDRIRFGEIEVPLERITAVFGQHANTRLEARHFALSRGPGSFARQLDHEPAVLKPRRNPLTGKIEENQPQQADLTDTRT